MRITLDTSKVEEIVKNEKGKYISYGTDQKCFLFYENNIYLNKLKHYELLGEDVNNYRYKRTEAVGIHKPRNII